MELKDTIEMMQSGDFKERFKAEYFQTKIRAEKLESMIEKLSANALDFKPKCSLDIFAEQLKYMHAYLHILEQRAEIEGIVLAN